MGNTSLNWPWVLKLGGFLFAFWLAIVLISNTKTDRPTVRASPATESRPTSNDRVYTATLCEIAMTERLKSPGTAKFPWTKTGDVRHLDGNRFRLVSYVDSQNGFGATVRTDYECLTEGYGDRLENWTLVALTPRQR